MKVFFLKAIFGIPGIRDYLCSEALNELLCYEPEDSFFVPLMMMFRDMINDPKNVNDVVNFHLNKLRVYLKKYFNN